MIYPFLFAAIFFIHPEASGRSIKAGPVQTTLRDTSALLSHRWLVTSIERAGKKTGANAGAMPLYMNFFSNGGFDFVGIGDGDLMTWKYSKGSVNIFHKSEPAGNPEASYKIEKVSSGTLQMSGMQAGIPVRYFLSHQPGD